MSMFDRDPIEDLLADESPFERKRNRALVAMIIFAALVLAGFLGVLVLSGCPPTPPAPIDPYRPPAKLSTCAKVTTRAACRDEFTVDHLACVVCDDGGVGGCYDSPSSTYCVSGTCADQACRAVLP